MKRSISFLLLSIFALYLSSCSGKKAESRNINRIYREDGVPVKIEKLKLTKFETKLSYHAVLSGIEESSAFAMVGDKVEKVLVRVGDYVKKDQVLVTFPTDNPAAKYYQARVVYENAKTAYRRVENLFKTGGISQQDLDNTKAGFDVAEANWRAARQKVKVKAPISGYVTRVSVQESDNVHRDAELVTISRTDKLKAKVWVAESEIRNVKKGLPAYAVWRDSTIRGKVEQVDMAMNQKVQAFGATLEFENPHYRLTCGITADIFIITYSNLQTMVVERKNILQDQNGAYVFIADQNQAKRRPVKSGREQGLDIEILEGLNPGDELIVAGQLLLKPGSKINVIK